MTIGRMNPLNQYPVYQTEDGLRRFENARIQRAVDDALAELERKEGAKNWAAVVHHVYNSDGTEVENVTRVSVAVKLADRWSIAAGAFKDWSNGEVGAEGKVIISG